MYTDLTISGQFFWQFTQISGGRWHRLVVNTTHFHVPATDSQSFNPLECKGNYSAASNNMKLVHWPLMGVLLHLVQRGGDIMVPAAARPGRLLAVPNVTAHPSTTSVPITVFMYNDPLLCSFNVPIEELSVDFCDFFLIL